MPASLVEDFLSVPFCVSRRATFAPGTTAPVESCTVPLKLADAEPCALALWGIDSTKASMTSRETMLLRKRPHTHETSLLPASVINISFGPSALILGPTPKLPCTLRITLNSTPSTPTLVSGSHYQRFSYIKLKLHLPNASTYRGSIRRLSRSFFTIEK